MKSPAFYYSFLVPMIMMGLYITYIVVTFSKSDSYDTGTMQLNTLLGMIYYTSHTNTSFPFI
jgi:hypothetical protein